MDKLKDFQLTIFGILLIIAVICGVSIISQNFSKNNITVTGSAYEIIKSDSATWNIRIKCKNPNKTVAYKTLTNQIPLVIEYLTQNGISKEQIQIMPSDCYETYKTNTTTGYSSNEVEYYNYSEPLKITSNDVDKIKELSVNITSLIEKGIDISSDDPQYQYSKLADLKIKLLENATKDAKTRATAMLKSNNNKTGKLQSVKMGVFQITPPDSNSVSDMGINDSSSIDKKVTAVANVVFSIK